ncbi:hypothetical protein [Nostoc sp. DedQUE09]|uniref:hypothetical protein n=1 Tax=Nostoc sp. DedQUE09 TaxID=3075394 RepID=UPI002AD2D898|nr:hypothetical protein [Nostoc sp. DedQUE09]MDZ7954164.1 hypothetical protein [Nostoc sp. DedQUE09]
MSIPKLGLAVDVEVGMRGRGAGEQRGRGAGEQGSRGAEGQGGRGAGEQRRQGGIIEQASSLSPSSSLSPCLFSMLNPQFLIPLDF